VIRQKKIDASGPVYNEEACIPNSVPCWRMAAGEKVYESSFIMGARTGLDRSFSILSEKRKVINA
jgi:hypothetical protein